MNNLMEKMIPKMKETAGELFDESKKIYKETGS